MAANKIRHISDPIIIWVTYAKSTPHYPVRAAARDSRPVARATGQAAQSSGPLAGQNRPARSAGQPADRPDDAGREDPTGPRHGLGRDAARLADSARIERRRRLCARNRAFGHPGHQPGRLRGWCPHGRGGEPLCHAASLHARRGGQLRSRGGLSVRLRNRPRAARPGFQHVHRRRRRPHPGAAQRAQFRICRRGSHSGRHHRRPAHEGLAGPAGDGRHQALRIQRPGNRAQYPERGPRQARHAGDRSAGLPDRLEDLASRGRHVLLQQA